MLKEKKIEDVLEDARFTVYYNFLNCSLITEMSGTNQLLEAYEVSEPKHGFTKLKGAAIVTILVRKLRSSFHVSISLSKPLKNYRVALATDSQ